MARRSSMAWRRLRRDSRHGSADCTFNTGDLRAISYYLYVTSRQTSELDDDLLNAYKVRLFFWLCKRLKCDGEFAFFTAIAVGRFGSDGQLTRLSGQEHGEPIMFNNSTVPYSYVEDKMIDRRIPCELHGIDEPTINLFRCVYVMGESFFISSIEQYLLRKNPDPNAPALKGVPASVRRALADLSALDFIKEAVDLSEDELRLLSLYRRINGCSKMAALYSEYSSEKKHEINREILDMPPRAYRTLTRSDSKIREFGFIDDDGLLSEDFYECLELQSFAPYFTDLITKDEKSPYPLDSFNVDKNAVMIMSRLLSGNESVSLLLYGKPGSGKTEFARAISHATGLKTLVFKNERELGNLKTSVIPRIACLLSFAQPDTVFIIDEADRVLKTRDFSFWGMLTPSENKGTVNRMLEANRNKIIWIVNFTNQIDESTLRRFNYSYRFDSMSREQLRSIAESKLEPLSLADATRGRILDLMEKYSVTGASVDNVVKTIKSLGAESDGITDCVQSVLKENSLLLNGKSQMRESVSSGYDTRALNASMRPEKIVSMIENAERFSEQAGGRSASARGGIRMLFYGLSGTGKTEFARYIAERLGKKILLKRASDILGMFVGESEKNIRDAFEEAARSKSILLFDEADSFFADRNGAEHSWERTQVNEFLTQMEEFPGILICTTNLKEIMDAAMNRRFHMIVEFKPLLAEGIRCLSERYFGKTMFSEEQLCRLEQYESVTPGDFGVLADRVRFMSADDVSAEYITEELCKMQDEKNSSGRRIGF